MAFKGWLKKDTNHFQVIGPFVASADGETAQAALTINQTDLILSKNGGTWASKAATGGATAQASGLYRIVIGSGDTDTAGVLDLFCHVSPALYVQYTYHVVPQNVWDSLIGGTALISSSASCATATQVVDKLSYGIKSTDLTGVTATQVTDKLSFGIKSTDLTGVTATQVTDKTGYAIAAGGIPVGGFAAGAINDAATNADMETAIRDSVWGKQVEAEGTYSAQQAMSLMLAVLCGRTTASGATFQTPDGVATRLVAALDANNQRTGITATPSA